MTRTSYAIVQLGRVYRRLYTHMSKSPKATIGHNNPPMTEADIKAQAHTAFADNVTGNKKISTAVQRLAYASYSYYMFRVANPIEGKPALPELTAYLSDKDAKLKLQTAMQAAFIDKPNHGTGKNQKWNSKIATEKTTYNTEKKLLGRAIELAAGLRSRKVTPDKFDTKTGMFTVPFVCLLNKSKGQNVKSGQSPEFVELDGKSYFVDEPDGLVRVNASVDQFNVALGKTPRSERSTKSEIAPSLMEVVNGFSNQDANPEIAAQVKAYSNEGWKEVHELFHYLSKLRNSPEGMRRTKGESEPKVAPKGVGIKDVAAKADAADAAPTTADAVAA